MQTPNRVSHFSFLRLSGVFLVAVGTAWLHSLTTRCRLHCWRAHIIVRLYQELYSGTLDCAKKMMSLEGPTSFFAGSVPRMVQVVVGVRCVLCDSIHHGPSYSATSTRIKRDTIYWFVVFLIVPLHFVIDFACILYLNALSPFKEINKRKTVWFS